MPQDLSNFEQVEYQYGDVPFTPHIPKRRLPAFDFDDDSDYLKHEPNYMLRALGGGLMGAAFGAVIFAMFVGYTGWTIGYLAVLVGFLVGKGMMMCSDNQGGDEYQFTAVILTFLAVSAAQALVVVWFGDDAISNTAATHSILALARYGLLYPVLELIAFPRYGIIHLFILYAGLRAAWRMTSDDPRKRSPFARGRR